MLSEAEQKSLCSFKTFAHIPNDMGDPRLHVAVIGAGISGVVAAAHLIREGIEVTVFERSSAAGGIW